MYAAVSVLYIVLFFGRCAAGNISQCLLAWRL